MAQEGDWSEPGSLPAASSCNLLLAADVVYQPTGQQLEHLIAAVAHLTCADPDAASGAARPAAAALLLVHKSRHEELDASLLAALRSRAHLDLVRVPFDHLHPDYRSPAIHCYVGMPLGGASPTAPQLSPR